jgi:hypothetical protein
MAATAHGTLTADAVSTVTIRPGRNGIEVINRSLTGTLWVRVDGGTPTVAGADTYAVLGARSFSPKRPTMTVKLISADALDFSVEAI